MATYRILGVNDDTDTCECCGKTGLKRVVWLERLDRDGNDEGGPFAAGVNCAAKLMRRRGLNIWRDAESVTAMAARAAREKIHEIGDVRSVATFYVCTVDDKGNATIKAKANGLRPAVEAWATPLFAADGRPLFVVNSNSLRQFAKVTEDYQVVSA